MMRDAPLPIALPLAGLAPRPEMFTHASTLHGQAHVSRVMVHAFRLIAVTGWADEAPRLWAAVYLHHFAVLWPEAARVLQAIEQPDRGDREP